MKSKTVTSAVADPLDFLDFCILPTGDVSPAANSFVNNYMNTDHLFWAAKYMTLSQEYVNRVIHKTGDAVPVPNVGIQDSILEDFVASLNPFKNCPLNLTDEQCARYEVYDYRVSDIPGMQDFFLTSTYSFGHYKGFLSALNYIVPERFALFVSRDLHGNINNLSFRVLDYNKSHSPFKYFLSHGRHATFGLHTCDPSKPTIYVEGARDYIAGRELGYQTVGLGTIKYTWFHAKYLEPMTGKRVMLLDPDSKGKRLDGDFPDSFTVVTRGDVDPFDSFANKHDVFCNLI
jgi:hypothetical protein